MVPESSSPESRASSGPPDRSVRTRAPRVPASWSAAIGVAAFVFYLALTPAVCGDGDSGEFTLVLATGGVPHPPGYPLYSLLGHGWVTLLHRLGANWAYGANSFSALGGAVAIGLVHALAARTVPPESSLDRASRAGIALVPCALLGLQPLFVYEATRAEVYTWHIAILAGLALVALRLVRAIADPGSSPAPGLTWGAAAWGLLCGTGLAHRPTTVFFILPLGLALVAALARSRCLRPAHALAFAGGIAIPLASYAFVAYRAHHPAAFQWPLLEPHAASVVAHIRSEIFTAYLGRFAPAPEEAARIAGALYPFLAPSLLLLLAVATLARERGVRWILRALVAAVALGLAFLLHYGIPDPGPYFLEALTAGLVALPAGVAGLLGLSRRPRVLAFGAAGVALLALGAWSLPGAVASHARLVAVERILHERWRAIPYERGIVLWHSDFFVRLLAYQILDGEQPGLYVVNPAMLTWAHPRRAFEGRLGFDPLAGFDFEDDSQLPHIAEHIARRTDLPVIDFERFRP